MGAQTAATAILLAALAGVALRPGRLPEAAYAAAGAALLVVLGLEPPGAAAHVAWATRGVLAFLAGVLVLAALADAAGLFEVAAARAVARAGTSAPRLFWAVAGIAVAGTVVLSLDAVAVALTPVVLIAARRVGAPAEPLLFACIACANAASLALPVSNPTNLVVADRLGLGLPAYAAAMLPAALAASAATALALRLLFRAQLRLPLHAPTGPPPAVDRPFARAVLALAVATLAGFVALPRELGAVALAAGAVGAAGAIASGRLRPRRALAATGPRVLAFALSTFVLVDGVARHGSWALLGSRAPRSPAGVAALGAALANALNNLPATILALPLARDASRGYALLVGVDVGPNLALTGSLATLLWLELARRRGGAVGAGRYLAVGLVTAPAGLAAALAVRWAAG